MTTCTKVQILSFEKTMSSHQWKELGLIKWSTCNCSYPMWKLIFQANMLRITSCVLVHSSSWAHNKRQMSIKGQWVRCKHNEENMQSKDGEVWTKSKTLWNFLSKVIETWDDICCKPCACPKAKIWQNVSLMCIKHFFKKHNRKGVMV